jgi:methyl-accepting chemotaxis protein
MTVSSECDVTTEETSQMRPKKSRRRKIYLGWKLHGQIVARFAMYWALYNLLFWQALCAAEFVQRQSGLLSGNQQIHTTLFVESYLRQNGWMVLFAVAFTPLFLWDIVRLTHRIVGPLKRMENVLYRMADGQFIDQIKSREDDLFEGFEKAFNTYLASLHAPQANPTAVAASASENAHPKIRATAAGASSEPLDSDEFASLLHNVR